MTTNDQCTLQTALEALANSLTAQYYSQTAQSIVSDFLQCVYEESADNRPNASDRIEYVQYIAINCPSAL